MQNRHDGGFTMIELIVVMVIVGFLVILTGPVLSRSLRGLELKKAVGDLSFAMRHAREQAISQQVAYSVRLNLKQDKYLTGEGLAEELADMRTNKVTWVRLPPDIDLRTFTGIDGTVESETGWIEFYPDGSSSGGSVDLFSQKGKGKGQVTLNPFTGLASVSMGMSGES